MHTYAANTRCRPNIVLVLGQRRRTLKQDLNIFSIVPHATHSRSSNVLNNSIKQLLWNKNEK